MFPPLLFAAPPARDETNSNASYGMSDQYSEINRLLLHSVNIVAYDSLEMIQYHLPCIGTVLAKLLNFPDSSQIRIHPSPVGRTVQDSCVTQAQDKTV